MSIINFDFVEKQIPIFKTKIPDYENINLYLKSNILDIKKQNPISDNSNVKGWHKWIDIDDVRFSTFISIIEDCCQFIFSEFFSDEKINFKCHDAWVMTYDEGDYTKFHTHYPADFSCIYYVDVEENASPLIIEKKIKIQPENGLLVIFPGLLDHEVPETTGKRIVFALNIHKMV